MYINIGIGGQTQGNVTFDFNNISTMRTIFQLIATKCPEVKESTEARRVNRADIC